MGPCSHWLLAVTTVRMKWTPASTAWQGWGGKSCFKFTWRILLPFLPTKSQSRSELYRFHLLWSLGQTVHFPSKSANLLSNFSADFLFPHSGACFKDQEKVPIVFGYEKSPQGMRHNKSHHLAQTAEFTLLSVQAQVNLTYSLATQLRSLCALQADLTCIHQKPYSLWTLMCSRNLILITQLYCKWNLTWQRSRFTTSKAHFIFSKQLLLNCFVSSSQTLPTLPPPPWHYCPSHRFNLIAQMSI